MNMRRASVARHLAAVVAAMAVAVFAALVAPAGPAYASFEPERFPATSGHNTHSPKTVPVSCPPDMRVYAGGAEVHAHPGGVALTSVIPDPATDRVTVVATARPGYSGPWSVTAYAVCVDDFATAATAVTATTNADSSVTMTCPGDSRLFGFGFHLAGPAETAYVREVAPNADLTSLRVSAGGGVLGQNRLTAIGMCHRPAESHRRVSGAGEPGAAWPRTAVTRDDADDDVRLFGVGGTVRGPGAFIDALVPDPDHDAGYVRGVLPGATAALSARSGHDATSVMDDDGGVSADAAGLGSFH
jgi:hypothetical protein